MISDSIWVSKSPRDCVTKAAFEGAERKAVHQAWCGKWTFKMIERFPFPSVHWDSIATGHVPEEERSWLCRQLPREQDALLNKCWLITEPMHCQMCFIMLTFIDHFLVSGRLGNKGGHDSCLCCVSLTLILWPYPSCWPSIMNRCCKTPFGVTGEAAVVAVGSTDAAQTGTTMEGIVEITKSQTTYQK